MKICIVLGTRPEIIKLFPLILELKKNKINFFIIHTGQHKIFSMQGQFIKYFNLKLKYKLKTDKNFLSETIKKVLKIYNKEKPDYIINQGDTNTVLASSLAYLILTKSKKTKLIHLEAGLRSFDKKMPEENNRIIADHVSDILLCPTNFANKNLKNENIDHKKIFKIGNTIADTINLNLKKINSNILKKLNLKKKKFFLLTLHRPDLVDYKLRLNKILKYFSSIDNFRTVFPIHPRTQSKIKKLSFFKQKNLILINPCNYLDFLSLQKNAKLIFTDSGGVQEEACILKTPCITIRKNTERPETIKISSNILVDYSTAKLDKAIYNFLDKKPSWSSPYGKNVSKKIIKILNKDFLKNER
jgi:UDP-N-acetylglucosamine 2-epimerase (non-hydrolysing)